MSNELVSTMTEKDVQSFLLPDSKIKLEMAYLMRLKEKNALLSRNDFAEFMMKAQTQCADPLKDQIYLVSYKSKDNKYIASVIFSYHFQLARAEASEHYDGFECVDGLGDYLDVAKGEIFKQPFVECKVWRKDRTRPTCFKAWFPEFKKEVQDYNTKAWKLNSQWASQPMNMLRKCAISNALKQAFPQELSGMTTEYDETRKEIEPENINAIPTTATVIEPKSEKEKVKEFVDNHVQELQKEIAEERQIVEAIAEQSDLSKNKVEFGVNIGKRYCDVEPKALRANYDFVKKGADERKSQNTEVSAKVETFLRACEFTLKIK